MNRLLEDEVKVKAEFYIRRAMAAHSIKNKRLSALNSNPFRMVIDANKEGIFYNFRANLEEQSKLYEKIVNEHFNKIGG